MRRFGPRQNPPDLNNRAESRKKTQVSLKQPEPLSISHDFWKPLSQRSNCSDLADLVGNLRGAWRWGYLQAFVTRVTMARTRLVAGPRAPQKMLVSSLISPLLLNDTALANGMSTPSSP